MHRRISLIAGGTGITPCWQIIRTVTDDPEDDTQVSFAYDTLALTSLPGARLCQPSEQTMSVGFSLASRLPSYRGPSLNLTCGLRPTLTCMLSMSRC